MAIGGASTMVWLGGQGGASVRYTGENGVIVNNSTDKISADFDVVQYKLTQGSNITITNNVISAQQPDVSEFVTSTEVSTAINNAIGNVRQVPASSGTDANKVLTVDAQGGYDWQPVPSSPSGVTDVKVDGTSVVTAGVANITMPTVPTKTSQLQNDSGFVESSSLATVATTGSYSDLSGKPSIPAAQVNSDWDAVSGVAQILHKPDLSVYAQSSTLSAVATSGSYNDLVDKPSIPTVDQTYDSTSSNPQSGVAVAQALAGYTPGGGGGVTPISTQVVTYDPTTYRVYGTVFTYGDFTVTLQGGVSSAQLYVENPNVSSAYVVSRVNGGCYVPGYATNIPDTPDFYYDVPSLVTPLALRENSSPTVTRGYPVFYDVLIMYTENNVAKTFGFTALFWTDDYVSYYTKANITAG